MSNLRLIDQTTVLSGVSSVSVPNVFTSDFDVYKIVGANFVGATSTGTGTNMRLIGTDGVGIVVDYRYASVDMKGEASFGEGESEDTNRFWNAFAGIDDGDQGAGGVVYVFNPANTSRYTFIIYESVGGYSDNFRAFMGVGSQNKRVAVTGVLFENNELVNFDGGGMIKTYGLRVDS